MLRNIKILIAVAVFSLVTINSFAQLNPLKSQYFLNSFLANPSQAGAGDNGMVSTGISSQWNRIAGAPEILSLTMEAPLTERMGIGAYVINDKSGLINRTVIMGSYSYKIPVSEISSLRFGLGLGYLNDNMNVDGAIARNISSDPAIFNYNFQHENLLKAGFGATYVFDKLELQSSWYGINRRLNDENKSADRSGNTTTIKYSFGDPMGTLITPLIGYRQIKGLSDYFDTGVNISYFSSLDLSFLYHSNKSITGGISYEYEKIIRLSCFYNSETPQVRGITGGTFEMSLSMPFSIKKK